METGISSALSLLAIVELALSGRRLYVGM